LIDYAISLLTLALINAIIVIGLNVRWGWAGEFDLSYYAFVAIGAYTTAVLVTGVIGDWWPDHPVASGLRIALAVAVVAAMHGRGPLRPRQPATSQDAPA